MPSYVDCTTHYRTLPGTLPSNKVLDTTPPAKPPKPPTLGDELRDSLKSAVADPVGEAVKKSPTFKATPNGPDLQASAFVIVTGPQGANHPNPGGPGVASVIGNFFKWLFVDATVITAKSEPVQEAAHKVVDASFDAAITVARVVVTTAKAIEDAATSTWNWIKSWF